MAVDAAEKKLTEPAGANRAAVAKGGESPLSRRLDGVALPKGGFTFDARAKARARLETMGLPVKRDEYWRYTDPAPFNAATPEELAVTDRAAGDLALFETLDRLRLVFVDGVLDESASDSLEGQGLTIDLLSRVDVGGAHWAAEIYGNLEAAGQNPVPRPLAALNTALAVEGVLIRVTGKPERPVHLVYRRRDKSADVILHHVILVEKGAELTLLDTGDVGARSNIVTEVQVAEGAHFHHVASRRTEGARVALSHIFARVGADARFKSFALAVNGSHMRQESVIDIVGDDAVAHVAAAVLGDGSDGTFHHDDTVFVTHAAERCESRQVFKKVLKNGAVGVFQGKILVKPGAQKTDGYQISQALLLDEDSQFLAKPELEIYADDVKCSHGSTTGALDETALFYLRSRGVPRDRAIVLLVLSFLADALAEVEDEALRNEISERLEGWLTRHTAAHAG
ncbi:SufB/SufD family protein [Paracoccus pacificus]|uniref:SufD family Fe-S cluster assembly protein n=1 Tax=Paracoccus pacificus TaxID=1463598 RepID=A0ABW4R3M9_9RHOB